MSSRNTLPPALTPYLRLPPEQSLILLTSTLGTSTSWLVSRFVGSLLGPPSSRTNADGIGIEGAVETETGENAVVLVSWLRDEKFWAGEVRRGTGLDMHKISSTGRFAFVDGLSALATIPRSYSSSNPDAALQAIERAITSTSSALSAQDPNRRITLILDAPDTLLATASTTPSALSTSLLRLRSKAHATVLTLSADLPSVSAAHPQSQPTPLELATANFLAQQAHAAKFVMGVRELETGAARDVSGVLRVTRGGDADEEEDGGEEVKEMEALFLVGRDGVVKVFERGSTS